MSFQKHLTAYYEEKGYLTSQFTFGFELEGFVYGGDAAYEAFSEWAVDFFEAHGFGIPSFDDDSSISPYLTSKSSRCLKCKGAGYINDTECPDCKGSGIEPKEMRKTPVTFEMQSPVFPCTPKAYQTAIAFLKTAKARGVRTNVSCSMHTHIGFPDKKTRSEDIFWVMCHVATDRPDVLKKLSKLKDIDFISEAFSGTEIFKNIYSAVRQYTVTKDFRYLKNLFKTDKFNLLNQHKQGTLEWRGPRNFLQQEDDHLIVEFFKQFNSIVRDFSDILQMTELKSSKGVINKQELYDVLKGVPAPADRLLTFDKRFYKGKANIFVTEAFKLYPWLGKAKFRNADISLNSSDHLEMQHATWSGGDFNAKDGAFVNGNFEAGRFVNGEFANSIFYADDAEWIDGIWGYGNIIVYKDRRYDGIKVDPNVLKQDPKKYSKFINEYFSNSEEDD